MKSSGGLPSALGFGAGVTSALLMLKRRAEARAGYRNTPFWRAYDGLAGRIDRSRGWYGLPTPLGLLTLIGVRNTLRKENLHDTSQLPSTETPPLPPWRTEYRTQRTPDGTYNDLNNPAMGRVGSRFGRNIPLDTVPREPISDALAPNPRTVSLELMTRHQFIPATSLNALAAAWLQFMIKDWFNHGHGSVEDPWHPAARARRSGRRTRCSSRARCATQRARRARAASRPSSTTRRPGGTALSFTETRRRCSVRCAPASTASFASTPKARSRTNERQSDPRQVPGFWLGLSMLARLFVMEHNAICDRLRQAYPALV